MNEAREKLLDKVSKLIAMQQSPNKEEAETAAIMVKKLITKYNIDSEQLKEIKSKHISVKQEFINIGTSRPRKWVKLIMQGISYYYDVKPIWDRDKQGYIIVGFDVDMIVCREMFWYIYKAFYKQAEKIKFEDEEGNSRAYREDFLYGAGLAIDDRLQRLKNDKLSEKAEKNTGTDLMVVKEKEISEYVKKNIKTVDDKNISKKVFNIPFALGQELGNNLPLNKQVNVDKKQIELEIEKIKKKLIEKVKESGIYENFGQDEIRELIDKHTYTSEIEVFDKWCQIYNGER